MHSKERNILRLVDELQTCFYSLETGMQYLIHSKHKIWLLFTRII